MDFNAIINWIKRNIKIVIPSALLLIFIGFLFFGGSTPDNKIPGGGFGTLVLAGLVFFGAHKAGEGKMRVILGVIATVLLVVAIWPRVFPLINFLGLAPNIIMILAISVGVWMFKGGKGLFAWRMFLFIFLVLCWIGANGKVFKEGFEGFKSSTGIEFKFPEIETPDFLKGVANYMGHLSASQTSKFKERLLKKDAYMYKYDGTNFKKSAIAEASDLKVFLLGETVQKDGLSFEKVRFNDPATGEEFWIYAGDLLTSTQVSTETLAPIQTTVKGGGQPPTQAVVEARDLVGEFPINLVGNILNIASGKNGERQGTGEVFIPHLCEAGYRYFITISGEYEKLFWNPPFKKMPWTGNDRLVGQGVHKPFPNLQYGAVTLRIGDQDGLVPKDKTGFVDVTINAPSKIFVELNINREIGDYMLNGTSKIRNSTLSLKIERRPI